MKTLLFILMLFLVQPSFVLSQAQQVKECDKCRECLKNELEKTQLWIGRFNNEHNLRKEVEAERDSLLAETKRLDKEVKELESIKNSIEGEIDKMEKLLKETPTDEGLIERIKALNLAVGKLDKRKSRYYASLVRSDSIEKERTKLIEVMQEEAQDQIQHKDKKVYFNNNTIEYGEQIIFVKFHTEYRKKHLIDWTQSDSTLLGRFMKMIYLDKSDAKILLKEVCEGGNCNDGDYSRGDRIKELIRYFKTSKYQGTFILQDLDFSKKIKPDKVEPDGKAGVIISVVKN